MVLNVPSLFGDGRAVFEDSPEDNQIVVWDGSRWIATDQSTTTYTQLIIDAWQTGVVSQQTMEAFNGAIINDGVITGTKYLAATAINEYSRVDLPGYFRITQWRYYNTQSQDEDGTWKIQYIHTNTGEWTDWVTGIATQDAGYTSWTAETEIITNSIRLVCTAVDTNIFGDGSCITELEVKY